MTIQGLTPGVHREHSEVIQADRRPPTRQPQAALLSPKQHVQSSAQSRTKPTPAHQMAAPALRPETSVESQPAPARKWWRSATKPARQSSHDPHAHPRARDTSSPPLAHTAPDLAPRRPRDQPRRAQRSRRPSAQFQCENPRLRRTATCSKKSIKVQHQGDCQQSNRLPPPHRCS
jgi:hypothetical protein